jgi:hypothetical protein
VRSIVRDRVQDTRRAKARLQAERPVGAEALVRRSTQDLEAVKIHDEKALDYGRPHHQFPWRPPARTFERFLTLIQLFDLSHTTERKGARADGQSEAQAPEGIPRPTGGSLGHGPVAVDRGIKVWVHRGKTVLAAARSSPTRPRTRMFPMTVLQNRNGQLHQSKRSL